MHSRTAKLFHVLILASLLAAVCSSAFYLVWTALSPATSCTPDGCSPSLSVQDKSCGAGALYAALARLGEPIYKPDLGRKLVPSQKGLSFAQLKEVAKQYGYEVSLKRLIWEELFSEQTAVLWIRDNHFVAVDPREKNLSDPLGTRSVRVYDEDKASQWWDQEQLEKIWHGEALAIKKSEVSRSSKGPRIEWDKCYQDCGFVDRQTPARYRYDFRNIGDKPLSIEIADTGCTCSKAELSAEKLEPGESGWLDVRVDLEGRRGYFQTMVLVRTNAPQNPENAIYAAGGALTSKVLASCETLYLGNIHQGQSMSRSACVYDLGDKKLVVTGAHLQWNHNDITSSLDGSVQFVHLETEADVERLDRLGTARGEPGDYMVGLKLSVPPDCPQGDFSGHIVVSSNLSEDFGQVRIGLRGSVVSDVVAKPSALLLMPTTGRALSAEVRLNSVLGKAFKISEVLTEGDISAQKTDIIQLGKEVLVKTIFNRPESEHPTIRGNLVVRTANKEGIVKIPVVIHMGQQ